MRILADVHISRRTVEFLRTLGHDVVRVGEALAGDSPDQSIVAFADRDGRVVLTQDLDFSAIIALRGGNSPSLISLRLSSSRVEYVNEILRKVLPELEKEVSEGVVVAVEDRRVRRRALPIGA